MSPEISEEVFPDTTVAQAIRNVSELVGMGVDSQDPEIPVKSVMEASYRVLDRKFGKPRETIELSHKIRLRIDVPGWGLPSPSAAHVIEAVLADPLSPEPQAQALGPAS